MKNETKSDYLDILQIFRGIAALLVVCHHTIGSIRFYHKIEYSFFNYIAIIGKFGVDFFFILSGFIITYTAYQKYNLPNSFSNYFKNRLLRIYVPYIPIGVLMLLLYSFLPNLSNADREISILTSLTLIPNGNPALSVAWTLTFELCFYLLFSISFFSRKSWNYFVIFWLVLIITFNYTDMELYRFTKIPFLKVFLSPYNIEFILGYFLALLIIRKKAIDTKLFFIPLTFSLTGFMYCILKNHPLFYFGINFLFAISMFIVIYLAILYYTKRINKTAIMMLIGNATYSIYLIHNPLQMLILRIFPKINSGIEFIFALFFVLIVTSLLGYLYYQLFEKRAMRKIKTII